MSIPNTPGFGNAGPIDWSTARDTMGLAGTQNINTIMANSNINKWSFYKPGYISIDIDKSVLMNLDTAPYKWGDWRNYYHISGIPSITNSLTYSFPPGSTSLDMTFPIFWEYLNAKQLSNSIANIMVEVWTSSSKSSFVGRINNSITWINESTIPDHSTTQTQRPSPGGSTPQILTLNINPQTYKGFSPLYAESWLTDAANNQYARFDSYITNVTLNELTNPRVDAIGNITVPGYTTAFLELRSGTITGPASCGSVTYVDQTINSSSYAFYCHIKGITGVGSALLNGTSGWGTLEMEWQGTWYDIYTGLISQSTGNYISGTLPASGTWSYGDTVSIRIKSGYDSTKIGTSINNC